MTDERRQRPWEDLERVVRSGDPERVKAYLNTLGSFESARAVSHLSQAEQTRLLEILHPRDAADLLEDIPELQAVDLIEDVPAETAAAIIQEMHSDEQVDLLGHFDAKSAAAILEQMPSERADQLRQWLSYPSHSAGGLMVREYLSYSDLQKVADVLDDLREGRERYAEYDVHYAYVVSEEGTLTGVLPLWNLLLAAKDQALKEIMQTEPVRVGLDAPLEQLEQLFDRHDFFGVPVVDEMDRLAGVVQRADMEEAATDEANKVYLESTGIVGGEELRSMPLFSRAFRRLSWLSTNVVLNIIAASVIAFYQDVIAAVIALAVFLPIISDMSGCSGNQAVAVSIRELTLGLVRPREISRVLLKECSVGLINGTVLGALIGCAAWLWQGNPYLGLVVGGALAVTTLVAVALGGLIPLGLRGLKLDPALASGPLLTTVTDLCGFFFALRFAQLGMARLVA